MLIAAIIAASRISTIKSFELSDAYQSIDARVLESQKPNNLLQKNLLHNLDSYDDHCDGEERCKICKTRLRCLSCMNICYNKWGKKVSTNPKFTTVISCHIECFDKSESSNEAVVDMRFTKHKIERKNPYEW